MLMLASATSSCRRGPISSAVRSLRAVEDNGAMLLHLRQKAVDLSLADFGRNLELALQLFADRRDIARRLDQFPDPRADFVDADIFTVLGAHHHDLVAHPGAEPVPLTLDQLAILSSCRLDAE